jgi:hypothetical protein
LVGIEANYPVADLDGAHRQREPDITLTDHYHERHDRLLTLGPRQES